MTTQELPSDRGIIRPRLCVPGIESLLLAALIIAPIGLCYGEGIKDEPAEEFSSLTKEHEFWEKWTKTHPSDPWCMESFYWGHNRDLLRAADVRLAKIAKGSKTFVLIVETNHNSGILTVIVAAKDDRWRQVRWERGDGVLDEIVSNAPALQEDVLSRLSNGGVFVDVSDHRVFDASSVYVFLRHRGRCSRFAIYNPPRHNPDADTTTRKPTKNPVITSLSSLLQSVGLSEPGDNTASQKTKAETYTPPRTKPENKEAH